MSIANEANPAAGLIGEVGHESAEAHPEEHHLVGLPHEFHVFLLAGFTEPDVVFAVWRFGVDEVVVAPLHVLLVTGWLGLRASVRHNQIQKSQGKQNQQLAAKVSKLHLNPSLPCWFVPIIIMLNNSNQIIQIQLLQLFNSIKVDKSKEAAIQKSTLISLLIYHQVDAQYPEYFRYVSRALEKFKKSTVTQEEFLKIFMNPEVDMGMADKNQLADAFGILDSKKTGSIDVKEFLEAYRMSQNYQQLTEDKKRQAEDEIKEAFYSASEDGKITPMDFYHIVKFR